MTAKLASDLDLDRHLVFKPDGDVQAEDDASRHIHMRMACTDIGSDGAVHQFMRLIMPSEHTTRSRSLTLQQVRLTAGNGTIVDDTVMPTISE